MTPLPSVWLPLRPRKSDTQFRKAETEAEAGPNNYYEAESEAESIRTSFKEAEAEAETNNIKMFGSRSRPGSQHLHKNRGFRKPKTKPKPKPTPAGFQPNPVSHLRKFDTD